MRQQRLHLSVIAHKSYVGYPKFLSTGINALCWLSRKWKNMFVDADVAWISAMEKLDSAFIHIDMQYLFLRWTLALREIVPLPKNASLRSLECNQKFTQKRTKNQFRGAKNGAVFGTPSLLILLYKGPKKGPPGGSKIGPQNWPLFPRKN